MLFGGAPKAETTLERPTGAKGDPTGGRILRSLVEPPEPVVEDLPPPVRRGRKPGSKNKPKLHSASGDPSVEPEVATERARRGRKPGSKNRPKVPAAAALPSPALGSPYDVAAAMRSYGFADDGKLWGEVTAPPAPEPSRDSSAPSAPAAAVGEARTGTGRPRLRDRSTILKRYVLDLEPRPGQPGALRARRLARAAR